MHLPNVRAGRQQVNGGLDPAVVQRVVRGQLGRIRHCYERGLLANPTLEGTPVVEFTIEATGKVSQAQVTGIDHTVAACIEQAIRAMQFPRPAGGGLVLVRYPFRLQVASGGAPADPPAPPAPPLDSRDSRPRCGPAVEVAPLQRSSFATDTRGSARPGSPRGPGAELERCFAPVLRADPGAVARATVVVTIDSRGAATNVVVTGRLDREVKSCLSVAVRAIRFHGLGGHPGQRSLACSLVLDNPDHSPLVKDTLVLSISHGEIQLAARSVADTYEIAHDTTGRYLIDDLFRQLATSPVGPLVITAHPTIAARVVERAVRTAIVAGFSTIRFARGVGTTESWMAVNPLATPDWGCADPTPGIAVTANAEVIVVVAAGETYTLAAIAAEPDFAGYRVLLDRLARSPKLRGRRDVAIAAGPELPYRVLLNLIEGAVTAGFFDTYQIPF